MKHIKRQKELKQLKELLETFPIVAVIGPRQCGKTSLAKEIKFDHYFDLENPRDEDRFQDPQLLLEDLEGTIIIDEIQRIPKVFPLLRHLADNKPKQKFIILGSAEFDLAKTSESLAGRVGYLYLTGFSLEDVGPENWKHLWLVGGMPKSFLSDTNAKSHLWLENYIHTFLVQDIPDLGLNVPSRTLRRFWTMLCHYHGQVLNYSELAAAFSISDTTVRRYIDLLESTCMIRILSPWYANIGKRLIKHPKIYIKDSGIFHHLISINDHHELSTHNKIGASWEGFALEQAINTLGKKSDDVYFWSTHQQAEIDLFWQNQGKNWGIEVKYHSSPKITQSMKIAIEDLKLEKVWVIYPGKEDYKLAHNIEVLSIQNITKLSH